MKALALAVLLASPASAFDPEAPAKALSPWLHFNGAIATRYLWQPSLRRETMEYLYYIGVRATAVKKDDYGLALQAYFDTFDTRRYIKGFASTGAGTVAAEPIFNFNRLFAEGYYKWGGRTLNAQFGVIALDLPTVQLPLSCVQVGGLAGLRADLETSPEWKFGTLFGNLRQDQTQEVPYKLEGVGERYNYARAWADHKWALGQTRAGADTYDSRLTGLSPDDTALFVEQANPILEGKLIPRAYVRYQTKRDLFSEVVASVEAKPFGKWLTVRPGYFYYNRSRGAVHPPNSNFFAPGSDWNNMFLYVESPLPRDSDSLYAAVTTGAKKFMAQQGTRFEAGVFLRFKKFPYLP